MLYERFPRSGQAGVKMLQKNSSFVSPKHVFSISRLVFLGKTSTLGIAMQPDYPNKYFNDKRNLYVCLMEALAQDARS